MTAKRLPTPLTFNSCTHPVLQHYLWAGLDLMIDRDGRVVLLEANKSSHMLGEYLRLVDDERPFELTAAAMNAAHGPPCILWRANDPLPDADEDVCLITRHLAPFLREPPTLCNVEQNQEDRLALIARDGRSVRPGSIFRWWYGLPWSYERAGALVINPNCLWMTVRDKFLCYETLRGARHFRVPVSFAVDTPEEAAVLIEERSDVFANGYVLKPRVGWGGYGVQIAEPGEAPRLFREPSLLSERIRPELRSGEFWDVRVFVMNGEYLGGLRSIGSSPNTNFFQGGRAECLDTATRNRLEAAALEAVRLIDEAAQLCHEGPVPVDQELLRVIY